MRNKRSRNLILPFNKKGNEFLDIIMVVLVLLGMAIMGLIVYNVFSDLNTDIQADSDISANAKSQVQNLQTNFPSWMDNAFLLVAGLLWVFLIISAFLIDTHPAFFVITIILLIFAFIIVMILSNTFTDFSGASEFTGYQNSFPITFFFMEHFLTIIMVMGFSVLIVLYGKNKFS